MIIQDPRAKLRNLYSLLDYLFPVYIYPLLFGVRDPLCSSRFSYQMGKQWNFCSFKYNVQQTSIINVILFEPQISLSLSLSHSLLYIYIYIYIYLKVKAKYSIYYCYAPVEPHYRHVTKFFFFLFYFIFLGFHFTHFL